MAADLHIHVMTEDMTERHLAEFFSNTLGSRWFAPVGAGVTKYDDPDGGWRKVSDSPNVHVGEVSWLKAALFEGGDETFVPPTVQQVSDIIGEQLPVIDDDMIARIAEALGQPNPTMYSLSEPNEILDFLKEHKGKRAFTVSW